MVDGGKVEKGRGRDWEIGMSFLSERRYPTWYNGKGDRHGVEIEH